MPAQFGGYDTLRSIAGKVFTYLSTITLTGTDGKTLTLTQDTSLDEAVAMSSKAPKTDVIKGDGTAGRVSRMLRLSIENGTNAATIKPSTASKWNGDVNAAENNLGKSGDTGVFELSVNGDILTIGATGISGDALGAIATIAYNDQASVLQCSCTIAGAGIVCYFSIAGTGAVADLTALIDVGGTLWVDILYVTSG